MVNIAQTHAQYYTHTYMYKHTHACTYTYTHVYILFLQCFDLYFSPDNPPVEKPNQESTSYFPIKENQHLFPLFLPHFHPPRGSSPTHTTPPERAFSKLLRGVSCPYEFGSFRLSLSLASDREYYRATVHLPRLSEPSRRIRFLPFSPFSARLTVL